MRLRLKHVLVALVALLCLAFAYSPLLQAGLLTADFEVLVRAAERLQALVGRALELVDRALLRAGDVPGEAVELVIEETTPIEKSVDIRTDAGAEAIAAYLASTGFG